MPAFTPVSNQSEATCGWTKVTDFGSNNKVVKDSNGISYRIIAKEERMVSSTEQSIYKFFDMLSCNLLSKYFNNIKNIIEKSKETRRFAIPVPKPNVPAPKPYVPAPTQSTANLGRISPEGAKRLEAMQVEANLSAEQNLQSVYESSKQNFSKLRKSIDELEAEIKSLKQEQKNNTSMISGKETRLNLLNSLLEKSKTIALMSINTITKQMSSSVAAAAKEKYTKLINAL